MAPKGGLQARCILAIYKGDSTDSLLTSYREALRRWRHSGNIFSESAASYVVNRDLKCGAARASESFGDANAKFFYNRNYEGWNIDW